MRCEPPFTGQRTDDHAVEPTAANADDGISVPSIFTIAPARAVTFTNDRSYVGGARNAYERRCCAVGTTDDCDGSPALALRPFQLAPTMYSAASILCVPEITTS